MKFRFDAIVIGCGPAGVSVGSLLAYKGKKVLIVDKMDRVGGRSSTYKTKDGYILDLGSHAVPNIGTNTIAQIFKILGIPLYKYKNLPGTLYWVDNTWKRPEEILANIMEDPELVQVMKEIRNTSFEELEKLDDVSVHDWISEKVKNEILIDFFRTGAMVISTLTDMREISISELIFVFKYASIGGRLDLAGYPEGGAVVMYQPLADYITSHGGEIMLNTKVEEIVIKKGIVQGIKISKITPSDDEFDNSGIVLPETESIPTDIVIHAAPIWDLFRLALEEEFPPYFVKMVKSLKGETSSSFNFVIASKQPITRKKPYHLVYRLPTVGLPLQAWQATRIIKNIAPEGKHLFWAGVPCEEKIIKNRKLLDQKFKELEQDLEIMFPGIWNKNNLEWVKKVVYVGIDGLARKPRLVGKYRPDVIVPGIKGLYVCGDTCRGRGIGIDSAARSGMLCAEKILTEKFDIIR